MNIEKLLKENNIDMSVEEFKGYTKEVKRIYNFINKIEKFLKNIFKEVA